jgi:membrane dipeptidase
VLESLDRFRRDVERPGIVETILTRSDLNRMESGLREGDATRYALLSVEGAEAIDGRMAVLEAWFRLGVRLVGLTWNGANCVADGVGELRGGGLTGFGREVVARMQELGMVVDVSHLSVRGVSDVLDMTVRPVVASHSNALSVHRHRRNLDDDQIRGIAATGGLVGATFVPAFIASAETVTVDDLLRHVDHLLTVAGPDAVGLGSDFDGIETTPQGLRGGADYPALLDALQTRYGDDVCHKLYGANWLRVLSAVLPA